MIAKARTGPVDLEHMFEDELNQLDWEFHFHQGEAGAPSDRD